MELNYYLTEVSIEIIQVIKRKGAIIAENGKACKNKEVFGFYKSPKLTICTQNIKDSISPIGKYVNETIAHESVHLAQSCKKGPLRPPNIQLPDNKMQDAKKSVKVSPGSQYNYEKEAYFLEDKPELVLYYLKKYCM
jgi:hypothetical protein